MQIFLFLVILFANKDVNKIIILLKCIFIGVLFLIAFDLRLKNYSTIPFPGQSVDEYSNSWVGLSIIKL